MMNHMQRANGESQWLHPFYFTAVLNQATEGISQPMDGKAHEAWLQWLHENWHFHLDVSHGFMTIVTTTKLKKGKKTLHVFFLLFFLGFLHPLLTYAQV